MEYTKRKYIFVELTLVNLAPEICHKNTFHFELSFCLFYFTTGAVLSEFHKKSTTKSHPCVACKVQLKNKKRAYLFKHLLPSHRCTRNKVLFFREWLDLRYFVGIIFNDLPESNPCEMLVLNIVNVASDESSLCKNQSFYFICFSSMFYVFDSKDRRKKARRKNGPV